MLKNMSNPFEEEVFEEKLQQRAKRVIMTHHLVLRRSAIQVSRPFDAPLGLVEVDRDLTLVERDTGRFKLAAEKHAEYIRRCTHTMWENPLKKSVPALSLCSEKESEREGALAHVEAYPGRHRLPLFGAIPSPC